MTLNLFFIFYFTFFFYTTFQLHFLWLNFPSNFLEAIYICFPSIFPPTFQKPIIAEISGSKFYLNMQIYKYIYIYIHLLFDTKVILVFFILLKRPLKKQLNTFKIYFQKQSVFKTNFPKNCFISKIC